MLVSVSYVCMKNIPTYVCIYVGMYDRIGVCIYVCTCVYMYVLYVCIHAWMHLCIYECISVCTYECMHE